MPRRKFLLFVLSLLVFFLVIDLILGYIYWQRISPGKFSLPLITKKEKVVTKKERIVFSSGVAGFFLKLSNRKVFNDFLTRIGFWQPNTVWLYSQKKKVTVNNLMVKLTDQLQPFGHISSIVDGQNRVYQAFGENFDNGYLELLIFIKPSILAKEEPEKLASRVQGMIIRSLYKLTHFHQGTTKEQQEQISGLIQEFTESKFVKIEKR